MPKQELDTPQLNIKSFELFEKAKDVVIHSEKTFKKGEELMAEIHALDESVSALDQAKKNDARKAALYIANAKSALVAKLAGFEATKKAEKDAAADLETKRALTAEKIKNHNELMKKREEQRKKAEADGKGGSIFKK